MERFQKMLRKNMLNDAEKSMHEFLGSNKCSDKCSEKNRISSLFFWHWNIIYSFFYYLLYEEKIINKKKIIYTHIKAPPRNSVPFVPRSFFPHVFAEKCGTFIGTINYHGTFISFQ